MNGKLKDNNGPSQLDDVDYKDSPIWKLRKNGICSGAPKAPLKKWVDYTQGFMERMALFPRSSRAVVAFSCGPDSVALSLLLKALQGRGRLSEVLLVHVHHGYREDSDKELEWAVKFAKKWDFQLRIEKISSGFWEAGTQNFEFRARRERYRLLWQHLEKGDKLYLGHHLDDSFEWSLHQMLRTTDLNSSLGIPVINGKKVRPLMAFSKSQLQRFLSLCGQDYCHDGSNENSRFARNRLRQGVIRECQKFSPQYLKNYVFRSNALAGELGLLQNSKRDNRGELIRGGLPGGRIWMSSHPQRFEGEIFEQFLEFKNHLKKYSTEERGKTRARFSQLAQAHKKHAQFPRGPFHFAGNVEAYLDWGSLFIIGNGEEYWEGLDAFMAGHFGRDLKHGKRKIIASQIPEKALKSRKDFLTWLKQSQIPFPFVIFAHSESEGGDRRLLKSLLGPSLNHYRLLPTFSQQMEQESPGAWWQVGQRFYDRLEKARERFPCHELWERVSFYALKFDKSLL